MTLDPTLTAIEQRMQRVLNMDGHPSAQVRQDARRLALDVQGLLDRLRAVTAHYGQRIEGWRATAGVLTGERDRAVVRALKAEQQVAAVRALHKRTTYPGITRVECDHDGDEWPCSTIRALDSAQPQDTPDEHQPGDGWCVRHPVGTPAEGAFCAVCAAATIPEDSHVDQ